MPRRSITLDNSLTADSAQASDPPDAGVRLFPHQKAALHAMNALERSDGITCAACPEEKLKTRIGVLGDKPGAGKSFVMLALALSGSTGSSYGGFHEYNISSHASVIRRDSKNFAPTSIIVIPHGLSKQWGEYLVQYMPQSARTILINRRKQFQEVTEQRLRTGFYTVIVVTTTMLPPLVAMLNGGLNLRVSRVFYDECDGIDVKHSSYIHAGFYWFVSASFHNLLTPRGGFVTLPDGSTVSVYGYYNSHLRAFFDPFQTVNENLVKRLAIFCDDDFVDRSLNLPEPLIHTVICKTPYSVRVLSGNVRASVIRALNAGDIDSAVRNMGAFVDTESNIVAAVVDRYRREKRALETRLNFIDDYVYQSRGQRESERARCTARISQLERSLATISERVNESVTCPICYEDFQTKTIVPCCQNSFCLMCITNWINSRSGQSLCPMCKQPVLLETCMVCREGGSGGSSSSDAGEDSPYSVGGVGFVNRGDKMENLKLLLTGAGPERRFLIFSEYDFSLEQSIAQTLRSIGVQYGMLKRNIHTINKVVNEFKRGSLRVLLINSAHYGCGMNLPEATDVVIMHKLNEGKSYKQVVGRAQRCQRTAPLNVWRLFNENEVDAEAGAEAEAEAEAGGGVETDAANANGAGPPPPATRSIQEGAAGFVDDNSSDISSLSDYSEEDY